FAEDETHFNELTASKVELDFKKNPKSFLHAIYFIYQLLCCNAKNMPCSEFEVGSKSAVVYVHPDSQEERELFDNDDGLDDDNAQKLVAILNQLVTDKTLRRLFLRSVKEAEQSDRQFEIFIQ